MESLTKRFAGEVFAPYVELLQAQYRFHPAFDHFKKQWIENLSMERLVHGPYLERSQVYKRGEDLMSLGLHEQTVSTITQKLAGRGLYKHQTDALRLILGGQNAVIATGTSSGKTLCFQIPILDDLLRDPAPGLRAIIIYPLNALVNDQLDDWEKLLQQHGQIAFARFTGQTPSDQADYEFNLRSTFEAQLRESEPDPHERERKVQIKLNERLRRDATTPNHYRHREQIRRQPPHILITNFSMLEYLLVRPVDAPIFQNAHLKFIVLDEAHAYRGVQATEIGFLLRRLKDRLGIERATCIATSATLGTKGDPISEQKVRDFATRMFDEDFPPPNPIYGDVEPPVLLTPEITPAPEQYRRAAAGLRNDAADTHVVREALGAPSGGKSLRELLLHDANVYRLRSEILSSKPMLLNHAAETLWPGNPLALDGLEALLELTGVAGAAQDGEDILPTRLHYFVRAQDGLHICLRADCPGRKDGIPAVFPSRKNNAETPEGQCPCCASAERVSQLVELVTCRKCGYLFGALQDLGPRRRRSRQEGDETPTPQFDSFSTELGWAADSFWSYFSVGDELPYPAQPKDDEADESDLILNPFKLQWCASCGKRVAATEGDVCKCAQRHEREIQIFHRQCPNNNLLNLLSEEKRLLTCCPNCGARNGSGLEPLRRFQESEDETGTAMAIPLAHFDVSPWIAKERAKVRKLLCFTDHRQRAAAFPSLLEEETFAHDMGRQMLEILRKEGSMAVEKLGERLAEVAAAEPEFFLPVSRLPDDARFDEREKRNLWKAEALSYFAVPDAARESVEDIGLAAVRYRVERADQEAFAQLMAAHGVDAQNADALLQTLLGFMRQHKAFTMPDGVKASAVAFGRVRAEIFYELRVEKRGSNTRGWLPSRVRAAGGYYDNLISDFLLRVLQTPQEETLRIAEQIWEFLKQRALLSQSRRGCQLFSNLIIVEPAVNRYVCTRCGQITAYSARACCPRKECVGKLEAQPFDHAHANAIARWAAGHPSVTFSTLSSEEHTAQVNKAIAAQVEENFRNAGVNLLSSTTTFEMGINIGDLQKILLRNAPPTSSSYVQRVGRAGRGSDKNSVCVTLCRGTKYDLDSWKQPERLMSGVVRPPTVFLENQIIAQRHFNAAVFAHFLRDLAARGLLGKPSQSIRLAGFLSPECRQAIPTDWLQLKPPDSYFDFATELGAQGEAVFFGTQKGHSVPTVLGGFDKARRCCLESYSTIMKDVSDELAALMAERKRLYDTGRPTSDVEKSIQQLLAADVVATLAKRGFLPRYAFPLDVVTLETKRTRWDESDVELSRDRAIAISEFAPGAQVIARKKVFTSAGLYIASKSDSPEREWYSVCACCGQIRTARIKDQLPSPCPVCGRPIPENKRRKFVQPVAFSISFEEDGGPSKFKKSSLVRQRQAITHFIDEPRAQDFHAEGQFSIAFMPAGLLFRYNLGPENKGFALCPMCGHSRAMRGFQNGTHRPLRASGRNAGNNCPCQNLYLDVAYGHTFRSHCLVARPASFVASVESLAYALQKGLCQTLELDSSDIGVAWRFGGDRQSAPPVEIILFDRAPGGAGFVQEGFHLWPDVVAAGRRICTECTCEAACYDCLKDYGNQSHHDRLDRISVIRFVTSPASG